MFELYGKYNTCKVFTDNTDDETISQLTMLLNQKCVTGEQIRIMPDTHAGKGCVIGTTMTLKNKKVIPNLVGVDIGCGMLAIKVKGRIDLLKLDSVIHQYIPSGFNIHEEALREDTGLEELYAPVNRERAYRSLGTLGGGNHFIELDRSESGEIWLVIHTGSRHLGIEVCDYYQDLGYTRIKETTCGGDLKTLNKQLVARLKAQGREEEISKQLSKQAKEYRNIHVEVPKALAFVEKEDFNHYIHDMKIVQRHAEINRATIGELILKHMKWQNEDSFSTIHNYIDTDTFILRKGSASAKNGERLIIPMNMRDGSLICLGKGNQDWNESAPHGAGRLMSRRMAKDRISMDDFKKSMEGIYTTCINQSTIDESAFAYKPIDEIINNIQETATICSTIRPVYNFKAGE